MGDDDLRSRFRRDFTSEPIGRPRMQPPQVPQRPASSSAAPSNPAPSSPVVRPPVAPVQTPVDTPPPKQTLSFEPPRTSAPKQKHRIRKKLIVAISILIILGLGGAGYWYKFMRSSDPIPANIKSSVNFPLLYPSKLPAGYKISNSSFSTSSGAVIFEADNQSSDKIAFSVQKRPPTFDFQTFYKQGLGNAQPFSTNIGEAAIGTVNSKPIGSFATDQSWMLVSSSSQNVTSTDIRLILNNIKQAN